MRMLTCFSLVLLMVGCIDEVSERSCVYVYSGQALDCRCTIINNKKEGLATCYDKDGNVCLTTNFSSDTLHGIEKTFYSDGKIKSEMVFNKGMPQGVAKKYFPGGQLNEYLFFFKGDSTASYHKVWDSEGNLKASKLPIEIKFNGQNINSIGRISSRDSFNISIELEYSEYDSCYIVAAITDASSVLIRTDTVFSTSTILNYVNFSKDKGMHNVTGIVYEILPPDLIGGVMPFDFNYLVK